MDMSVQNSDDPRINLYMQVAKLCERTKEMSDDISEIKRRLNHLSTKIADIEKDIVKMGIFWKILTVLSPAITVALIKVVFGSVL